MSSIMGKIFGSKTNIEAAPQDKQQSQGGAKPQGDGNITGNDSKNMMVPDGKQPGQKPQQSNDPLAPFADIFYNAPVDGKKQAPQYKLSPDVIKQAADSLDYSDSIPKDFKKRMAEGDDTVWAELVNGLGRKAYSHALEHNSVLTDRFVSQRSEFDRSGYGTEVTKTLAKQSLKSIAEKSPAAAKFLEGIHADLLEKNPDATPEWLEEQSKKFILSMGGIIAPDEFVENKRIQEKNAQDGGDVDWDKWSSPKR